MVGDPKHDQIKIINHFYVEGMGIQRTDNPCLSGYVFAFKGDTLTYTEKTKAEAALHKESLWRRDSGNEKSLANLERMLGRKTLY